MMNNTMPCVNCGKEISAYNISQMCDTCQKEEEELSRYLTPEDELTDELTEEDWEDLYLDSPYTFTSLRCLRMYAEDILLEVGKTYSFDIEGDAITAKILRIYENDVICFIDFQVLGEEPRTQICESCLSNVKEVN